jgi:hypothetical protein
MRTAPPSEFVLTRFGSWRGAMALLCAGAAAATVAWAAAVPQAVTALGGAALSGVAIAAALAGVLRRPQPICLRGASPEWFVGTGGAAAAGPYRIDVPIDLGVWMLLRLRAEGLRTVWIPAQRRGHEAQWHGLRRAVYSPRPTVGGPPGAEPHPPE